MEIQDSFVVAATPAKVWDLLLDVERVAPCMPGAQLTETIDERTWRGSVRMKMGPVRMTYTGQVVMVDRDDANMTVTLRGEGSESSGKGNASATVKSRVEPTDDGGSRVLITQDLALSGMAAQFGARMIQDVSTHLTKQFAKCLEAQLTATEEPETAPAATETAAVAGSATPRPAAPRPQPVQAKEIPALRLAFWAMGRAVGRLLRLPWGKRKKADATTKGASL